MTHEPISEFELLLDLLVRLVESQAHGPIPAHDAWINDAQVLSVKLYRHLFGMHALSPGFRVEHRIGPVEFVDHASIKVLCRAALETYLVFFYIFGTPSKATARYRHLIWHIGGLADRQRTFATSREGQAKQDEEKELLRQLREELVGSEEYLSLPPKAQKKIAAGEWRYGLSWVDIGVSAGFHEKYFRNVYGYLCGYAHSSYISALQVAQANDLETQRCLAEAIIGIGVVIMAHFSFTYCELFPEAASVMQSDKHAQEIAKKWHFTAANMNDLYGRTKWS